MTKHNEAYQKSLSRTNQGDGLDFWRTPPQATMALMEREKFEGIILEPACGTGEMSDVLKKYSKLIISSDIVYRGYKWQNDTSDFFETETKFGNVITNPPFNLAIEFIHKSIEVATE